MRPIPRAIATTLALATATAVAQVPAGDLAAVQAHLRAVRTMSADFVQTDAKGRAVSGTLQLKRPGHVRFQYQKGVPLLVVGDGKALTMIDYQVRQVSRWPIGNTPLALLLDPDRDITRFARTIPSGDAGQLLVAGADPKHREYGSITVAFRRAAGMPGGLVLEGWTVTDAQNARTTVRLANQHFNVPIGDNAFRWNDPRVRNRR